ncbi:MAG: TolB family protein, partial [Gemmatimonadota bacterium]
MTGRIRLAAALSVALAFPVTAQDAPPGAGGPGANGGLPLKAARTHAFTTTKGTWISLDVSPDGARIVFDLLGDLYTLPIAGGKATRLTSGMGYDAQPRWSPDGKKVVFVSDRSGGENVWLVNADGSDTTALTSGNLNQ